MNRVVKGRNETFLFWVIAFFIMLAVMLITFTARLPREVSDWANEWRAYFVERRKEREAARSVTRKVNTSLLVRVLPVPRMMGTV